MLADPVITRRNRRSDAGQPSSFRSAACSAWPFLADYYTEANAARVAVLRDGDAGPRALRGRAPLASREQAALPVTWNRSPPVVVQAVLATRGPFRPAPGVGLAGHLARELFATDDDGTLAGRQARDPAARTHDHHPKERQLRRKLREVSCAALANEISKQEISTLFGNTQFPGKRPPASPPRPETLRQGAIGRSGRTRRRSRRHSRRRRGEPSRRTWRRSGARLLGRIAPSRIPRGTRWKAA